jgi:esterase/lipase superfamily enzyme
MQARHRVRPNPPGLALCGTMRPWRGRVRLWQRHVTLDGMTIVALLVIVALAACAPRGTFSPTPPDAQVLATQTVFLATQRGGPSLLSQTGERTRGLRYGQVDVTIPVGHEPGQVEWPRDGVGLGSGFGVSGAWAFPTVAGFQHGVRSHPAAAVDNPITVFVPGYNNTLAEATFRQAQIAHDYQMSGPQVLFAWPSAAEPLGYIRDRDSAIFARDALERLLTDLAQGQDRRILLVGHSMGGQLVAETLRQMSIGGNTALIGRLEGVILLSPDIDVDVFQTQLDRIDPMPNPFVIVVSQHDRLLRLSARLTGQTQRLGSLEDIARLAAYPIIVIDLTAIPGEGDFGHLIPATSPVAIALLRGLLQTGLPDPPPNDGAIQAVQIVLGLPD